MELDGIVKRSESKNQQKHTSTMAATMSSNYWTATAFYTMFQQHKEEEEGSTKYTHDDCGVKCFVTADAPNDFTPLEDVTHTSQGAGSAKKRANGSTRNPPPSPNRKKKQDGTNTNMVSAQFVKQVWTTKQTSHSTTHPAPKTAS